MTLNDKQKFMDWFGMKVKNGYVWTPVFGDNPHTPTINDVWEYITENYQPKTTSNIELEKNALIALEEYFGHILNDGSGKPMQISLEEVANDVIGLFRAKTTSTDIESLGLKEILSVIPDCKILPKNQRECGYNQCRDEIVEKIQELYLAPHLSNKSDLKKEAVTGETSDGYHTFNELYEFRKLYNACFFNEYAKQHEYLVHKSKKHFTGELCFGGGWFIVVAYLPNKIGGLSQISNHYEMKDWDLFQCPEKEFANVWDGHTAQDVAKRLKEYLSSNEKEESEKQ